MRKRQKTPSAWSLFDLPLQSLCVPHSKPYFQFLQLEQFVRACLGCTDRWLCCSAEEVARSSTTLKDLRLFSMAVQLRTSLLFFTTEQSNYGTQSADIQTFVSGVFIPITSSSQNLLAVSSVGSQTPVSY